MVGIKAQQGGLGRPREVSGERRGGRGVEEECPGGEAAWPGEPIRDMTAEQLTAMIARLRTADTPDEILIRALQTELTFRQVGIRKERRVEVLDTNPA